MKKSLVLVIFIIINAEVKLLNAQELIFAAHNKQIPNLSTAGVTGAAKVTGYLNTAINACAGIQANGLPTFNAVDVAVGDL